MTSAINWAVLGLVIERPSYGHELFHRFERMYGDVMPLSGEPHIYAALNALEGRKLVMRMGGSTLARQPKPCYRATEQGVSGYEDWLVGEAGYVRRREELWVRQIGVFAHDPSAALRVLSRSEAEHLKRAGQAGRSRRTRMVSRADLVEDLVAERQRLADGEVLSWLQYAQDTFELRVSSPAADESPGT
jgi:DNA-binding PadR family transcriptional regulator